MTDQQDEFQNKGAVEQGKPKQPTNTSLSGQLGHREQNPLVEGNDTDFPEQGNSPEHSGQSNEPPDRGMLFGHQASSQP